MKAPLPFPVSGGKHPYIFPDKPAGARCAWTCKWVTSSGIIPPGAWAAVEDMTPEEVIAELEDVAAWRIPQAGQMLESYRNGQARGTILQWIRQTRENYPECILWLDPPEAVFNEYWRPGWETTEVKSAWKEHLSN